MTDWMALISGYLASGDDGELDVLSRYLHDDVVVHDPSGRTTTGLVHEKEIWQRARAAMPGLRHTIQQIVASESTAAARIRVSGTLHGTFAGVTAEGKPFEIDQALFMRLSKDRVQEIWVIVDTGDFYKQVGAVPEWRGPTMSVENPD